MPGGGRDPLYHTHAWPSCGTYPSILKTTISPTLKGADPNEETNARKSLLVPHGAGEQPTFHISPPLHPSLFTLSLPLPLPPFPCLLVALCPPASEIHGSVLHSHLATEIRYLLAEMPAPCSRTAPPRQDSRYASSPLVTSRSCSSTACAGRGEQGRGRATVSECRGAGVRAVSSMPIYPWRPSAILI